MNEVNEARQIEKHTAELLETESTAFEVEMAAKNLKIYISRGVKFQENRLKQDAEQ